MAYAGTAADGDLPPLYVKCRNSLGRETSPTACVIDSQSVKGTEKGSLH